MKISQKATVKVEKGNKTQKKTSRKQENRFKLISVSTITVNVINTPIESRDFQNE